MPDLKALIEALRGGNNPQVTPGAKGSRFYGTYNPPPKSEDSRASEDHLTFAGSRDPDYLKYMSSARASGKTPSSYMDWIEKGE